MRTVGFLLFVLLLAACRAAPTAPAPALAGAPALIVAAPERSAVGEVIPISVHGSNLADGTPVLLVAHGSFGVWPQRGSLQLGKAEFQLTPLQTSVAGAVSLAAYAGALEAAAETTILPGAPVDPILPLVGPRSIVADGAHTTMVVAIPLDRERNPVADMTSVIIRAQHPAQISAQPGPLDTFLVSVNRLLAWTRVPSRTRAGVTRIAVLAGSAFGPERTYDEVPGAPAAITVHAAPRLLAADGRSLVELSTEPIADQFGNRLLDGASVQFIATPPEGEPRVLPAVTIDGRAYTRLQAPNAPGLFTITASSVGATSPPVTILFTPGPDVETVQISAQVLEETVLLRAGPVVGPLGQFVADGTQVDFTLLGAADFALTLDAQVDVGYAETSVRRALLPGGRYTVTVAVGGGQGQITIEAP